MSSSIFLPPYLKSLEWITTDADFSSIDLFKRALDGFNLL